jgi:hypothetical protein
VFGQSEGKSQIRQHVRIVPSPDTNEGDTRGCFEMSAQAILAGIIGLTFDRIEIREIEAVFKIAGIEIGIAKLSKQAGLVGQGWLENKIGDPPTQIAIRVNTVCARVKLAEAHREIAIQSTGHKGAANRAEGSREAVGEKA